MQEAGKEITRSYYEKDRVLEYRPLVTQKNEGAAVLKLKVGEKTSVYTHKREVGDLQLLTPQSKCLAIAEYTCFWFTDTHYAVCHTECKGSTCNGETIPNRVDPHDAHIIEMGDGSSACRHVTITHHKDFLS